MNSIVANMALASSGHDKIAWVKNFMPVMSAIEREFSASKSFAGKNCNDFARQGENCVHGI